MSKVLALIAAVVFLAWLAWLTWRVRRLGVGVRWLRRDANGLLAGYRKLRRRIGWRDDLDATQVIGDPLAMTRRMDPDKLASFVRSIAPDGELERSGDAPAPPSLPDAAELVDDDGTP